MLLVNRLKKSILIIELSVPWEERMDETHERKKLKYEGLRQACEDNGWKAKCFAIEVGCRGFVGYSIRKLLQEIGGKGSMLRRELDKISAIAEKASAWLWLKRNDGWARVVSPLYTGLGTASLCWENSISCNACAGWDVGSELPHDVNCSLWLGAWHLL